jgi:hypothetical protein
MQNQDSKDIKGKLYHGKILNKIIKKSVITTRIRIQILLKRINNYYLLDSIGKRVACALVKTFNSRKINKIQQINLIHSQKDSNFNTHVNKSQQTQFPDSNKSHEFS